MKLELKHLAPYLPYGLNGVNSNHSKDRVDFNSDNIWTFILNYKPILRPLSDLTKETQIDGKKFVPLSFLLSSYKFNNGWDYSTICDFEVWALDGDGSPTDEIMTLNDYLYLFEWHFDVFGLIEKGLAIDINTL